MGNPHEMSARSKIPWLLILAAALVVSGVVVVLHTVVKGRSFDRTVQLSNSTYLRLHGTPTWGPDSGSEWEVLYPTEALGKRRPVGGAVIGLAATMAISWLVLWGGSVSSHCTNNGVVSSWCNRRP